MAQKSQYEVIDALSDALALLAPPDTRGDVKARLYTAIGDFIECNNSISTNATAHELVGMLVKFGVLRADQAADHLQIAAQGDEIAALDKRTDRRSVDRDES